MRKPIAALCHTAFAIDYKGRMRALAVAMDRRQPLLLVNVRVEQMDAFMRERTRVYTEAARRMELAK